LGELKPEDQVILLGVRRHRTDPLDAGLLKFLDKGLDWTYIENKARSHRVYPLLYQTLKHFGRLVPTEVLARLRLDTYQNAARNLLAKRELSQVLRRFQEHDITVMPIKGHVWAESLYGHIALRVFTDLDILVPADRVLKAKCTLLSLGYRPGLSLNPAEEGLYIRTDHEYHFNRISEEQVLFRVEIHWNALPGYCVPLDPWLLWRNASQVEIESVRYAQMSPESQFLAMCLHAWKHSWTSLQWVCDLNEFVSSNSGRMNWSEIYAWTQALGIDKIVSTSLSVLQFLFGMEASPELLTSPARMYLNRPLPSKVRASIFPNDEEFSSNLQKHRFYASFKNTRQERLKYFWSVLVTPTPTDFRELSLPECLAPLYWSIRPLRLTWKVLRGRQRF
jgi:putative nucleotidyltransferase-like protein